MQPVNRIWEFQTAPRFLLPILVIFNFVSFNITFAVSYSSGFTISHDIFAFGKDPIFGPKVFVLFH